MPIYRRRFMEWIGSRRADDRGITVLGLLLLIIALLVGGFFVVRYLIASTS